MSAKEVFYDDLRIKRVGNCFVSVASLALKDLGKSDWDPEVLKSLLPRFDNHNMELVCRCLEPETGLKFGKKVVRKSIFCLGETLVEKLDKGFLCELTVASEGWVGDVLKQSVLIEGGYHSVMVFGYYAPCGSDKDLWLYMTDSYSGRLLFFPIEKIFDVLESSESIEVGLFSSTARKDVGFSFFERLVMSRKVRALIKRVKLARGDLIKERSV